MKVYIDLILFINYLFDFILLYITNKILKRNICFLRLFIGSIIGSLTILVLFIPFSSKCLFIFKIILSFIIIIITFGYKDLKYFLNNLLYFYILSIILGGFIYYLNIEFSYSNIAMVFYSKGLSINYIVILIISPIILLIVKKKLKDIKEINSSFYELLLYINNKTYRLNSFLDTGNTLIDPITNKKVIITNNKKIINDLKGKPFYLVPYSSVNTTGYIKCIKINKLYINGVGIRNDVVLGLTNKKLKKNGVNTILNYLLVKGN